MTAAEVETPAVTLEDFAGQSAVTDGLLPALRKERSVHAYLITGPAGVGKRTLARLTAAHLLCEAAADRRPCGVCSACRRMAENAHSDLTWVVPGTRVDPGASSSSQSVIVDDIRALNTIVAARAGGRVGRVAVLEDASKMLPQAQNALLKTLEEPPERTTFLLVCEDASVLLPTIISRCRAIRLHPWEDAYVSGWLKKCGVPAGRAEEAARVAEGSVGRALEMASDEGFWQKRAEIVSDFFGSGTARDIPAVSAKWKEGKTASDLLLDTLDEQIRTMLQVRLGLVPAGALDGFAQPWQRFAEGADLGSFARLRDSVKEARRMRESQVTWQAVVERMMFRLTEESRPWRKQ